MQHSSNQTQKHACCWVPVISVHNSQGSIVQASCWLWLSPAVTISGCCIWLSLAVVSGCLLLLSVLSLHVSACLRPAAVSGCPWMSPAVSGCCFQLSLLVSPTVSGCCLRLPLAAIQLSWLLSPAVVSGCLWLLYAAVSGCCLRGCCL